MRTILFRGKRAANGVWVYGDLRQWESGQKGIWSYDLKHMEKVLPETVGQFTGLLDNGGKMIFEGDIIRAEKHLFKYVGAVVYNDKGAKFGTVNAGGEDNYSFLFSLFVKEYNIRVIGNIHDSPELLGKYNEVK